MARIAPFESHTRRYESWFAQHEAAYLSELRVVRELLPDPGLGLEIGVGTGRFANPLGIAIGTDPSLRMLEHARRRGIAAVCAVAEALPFRHDVFDHALIVTTICFVDDARAMLSEACRVLKPEGALVLGFIDRTSRLGRHYELTARRACSTAMLRSSPPMRSTACSPRPASASEPGARP
jgi:ubiquinone/menaquinone biosynthesis C-methylase UbiE